MNPLLLVYIFIAAFLIWVFLSRFFFKFGGVAKDKAIDIKTIMEKDDEKVDEEYVKYMEESMRKNK